MLTSTALAAVATTVADPGLRLVDPQVVRMVADAKAGSSAAVAEFYDLYVDRVHGFVMRRVGDRHLAEDLTADVFMRAIRRLDSFEMAGTDPIAWLLTIARNRVHDHFRSSRFRMEHLDADAGTTDVDPGSGPGDHAERVAIVGEVQRALVQLKAEHAEVLHLRFVEDLSVGEVAVVMDRKPGAIRVLQHRALKALAKHVDLEAVI